MARLGLIWRFCFGGSLLSGTKRLGHRLGREPKIVGFNSRVSDQDTAKAAPE